jgi:signal transduction histidine kinase
VRAGEAVPLPGRDRGPASQINRRRHADARELAVGGRPAGHGGTPAALIVSLVDGLGADRAVGGADALAGALADAYVRTRPDGTILAANDGATALRADAGSEVVGSSIVSWFLSVDHTRVRQLLDTRTPDVCRESLVMVDGRDAEIAFAWTIGAGDALAAHWLIRVGDASTEPDLGLPVATYTCRAGSLWTCVSMSPRLEELVGVSADHVVADPVSWLEMVAPADRERLIDARLRTAEQGANLSCVYRVRAPGGRTVWIRDEAVLAPDGLVHGILLDASIEHRRDEVLVQLHESSVQEVQRLRDIAASRDLLFRTFAHDVRAAAVGGRTLLQAVADEKGTGAADSHLASLEGALAQVMDLAQAMSELETRAAALEVERIAMDELVRRAVAAVAAVAAESHEIHVDVRPTVVVVDPALVIRMLTNLVSNAVRHTPGGTRIRVAGQRTRRGVMLTVEDDGPGVAAHDHERIFQPLIRGGQETDGLGLGLSLVRHLAELHGGEVWAESLPAGGISFTIALPQPG